MVEVLAGLRPGTPDNAPLIGWSRLPGLLMATGHHRNGILLTPITANVISGYVLTGQLPEVAAPFVPDRYI